MEQTPEQRAAAQQLDQVFKSFGPQLQAVADKATPRIGAALAELVAAVAEAASC